MDTEAGAAKPMLPAAPTSDTTTTPVARRNRRPRRSSSSSPRWSPNVSSAAVNGNHPDGNTGKIRGGRYLSVPPESDLAQLSVPANTGSTGRQPSPNQENDGNPARTRAFPARERSEGKEPSRHGCRPAMGVSLPRYELGGPAYKRPRSLLYDPPEDYRTGRFRFDESDDDKEIRTRTPAGWPSYGCRAAPSHFAGRPVPPKVLGVCSECGIGEAGGPGSVLILCDGPGCNREFHLSCCRPPLREVPEDDEYFCFDCHPGGGHAAALLEEYLEGTERDREAYHEERSPWPGDRSASSDAAAGASPAEETPGGGPATPVATRGRRRTSQSHLYNHDAQASSPALRTRSPPTRTGTHGGKKNESEFQSKHNYTFVDQLIYKDLEESQSEYLSQIENGICGDVRGKGPPVSELEVFHKSEWRRKRFPSPYVSSSHGKSHQDARDDHVLEGCAIRLFCTKSNMYHTGRILRVRERAIDYDGDYPHLPRDATARGRAEDGAEPAGDHKHHDETDTECLVRFPAGREFRKKSVTRWIRLEEHSLAVACPDLAWAVFEVNGDSTDDDGNAQTKRRKSPQKKQRNRWMPAKLWMRSSRELVVSMAVLDEARGQIRYRRFRDFSEDSPWWNHRTSGETENKEDDESPAPIETSSLDPLDPKEPPSSSEHAPRMNGAKNLVGNAAPVHPGSYLEQDWILAECIGYGKYSLVHIPTETKECGGSSSYNVFEANQGKTSPTGKKSSKKRTSGSSSSDHKTATGMTGHGCAFRVSPRDKQVMAALVQAEREERDRVKRWNKLPLRNAWHPKALVSRDEFALGALDFRDSDCGNEGNNGGMGDTTMVEENDGGESREEKGHNAAANTSKRSIVIHPSPLIRTGLDRMYIMDQFVTQFDFVHGAGTRGRIDETSPNTILTKTRDLAVSLSCDLVCNDSITSHIQQENRMVRSFQKDPHQGRRGTTESNLSVEEPSKLLAVGEELAITAPPIKEEPPNLGLDNAEGNGCAPSQNQTATVSNPEKKENACSTKAEGDTGRSPETIDNPLHKNRSTTANGIERYEIEIDTRCS
ncbi:unnamed protein product [Pseudo-nitzschia multistriata]|uniref:PHD-type domain-containing protein n=1 Tax=Pseudo-nitzschia multistriata TaxID=183589 RepID=A0A448YYE1_9STRA|nr:unnamed protein product [Pseudo-nitzschia multistriata]